MPSPPTATLRRLVALARPELRLLIGGLVALALASLVNLLYPQGIRLVIDVATGHAPAWAAGRSHLLELVALAMAGAALVSAVAMAIRAYLFGLTGERVVARLRERLYRAILSQEIAFFDAQRTGDLISRLSADTGTLQSAVSGNLSTALRNLAQLAGALALLVVSSWRLTLVIVAVVPPIAFGAVIYGRRVRRLAKEVQDALAEGAAVAGESLGGVRTVRSFAAEDEEQARYQVANDRTLEKARRRARAGAIFQGSTMFAAYTAVAVVFWYGGHLVASGEMTAGQLTSFLVYALIVGFSLGTLADIWAETLRAAGAGQRVFELLDRQPAIPTRGGEVLPHVEGRVELERVAFRYPTRPDVEVLSGVDLCLAPGEKVALVGPSGAGKSTIAALLLRFYDPTVGAVRIDGRDIRDLDPAWLRRQIGTVAQEPVLFSTSVAENIRYGRPEATRAEIEAAHADGFVRGFPDGYDTLVGERGVQLSGGQKQRVTIARALLKDPRILILDEATSALDAESEHLVKEALRLLMRGRTTLIIAHRLSTVKDADRVIVLDGGRMIEEGTHDQLMARTGLYRRLIERQFVVA
jgi:ATP-binding cassette subfamily B protein